MERPGSELPIIIGQSGPLKDQRWPISTTLTLGRETNCDIVIPTRQVSRYHAQISFQQNGVILEDLGSKNGTYHNGELLECPISLKDGDTFQIALIQGFVFYSSDATMPLETGSISEAINKTRLSLDTHSKRVWVNNIEITPPLSVPQFRLLQALFENNENVVSRQDLIIAVWGDEEAIGVSEQALDALIRRLRDKLATIDPDHQYILTIRGHGLRLDNSPN